MIDLDVTSAHEVAKLVVTTENVLTRLDARLDENLAQVQTLTRDELLAFGERMRALVAVARAHHDRLAEDRQLRHQFFGARKASGGRG